MYDWLEAGNGVLIVLIPIAFWLGYVHGRTVEQQAIEYQWLKEAKGVKRTSPAEPGSDRVVE